MWSPLRASSDRCFPIFSPEGGLDWSPTARVQRGESATARCTSTGDHLACPLLFQACSFALQGWGLIDLPLRASNEGLPRPRVARAQKTIRLHPLLCSASKKGSWPLLSHPSEAARCVSTGDPQAPPSPLFLPIHPPHCIHHRRYCRGENCGQSLCKPRDCGYNDLYGIDEIYLLAG